MPCYPTPRSDQCKLTCSVAWHFQGAMSVSSQVTVAPSSLWARGWFSGPSTCMVSQPLLLSPPHKNLFPQDLRRGRRVCWFALGIQLDSELEAICTPCREGWDRGVWQGAIWKSPLRGKLSLLILWGVPPEVGDLWQVMLSICCLSMYLKSRHPFLRARARFQQVISWMLKDDIKS